VNIRALGSAVEIEVLATPGSSVSKVRGVHGSALKVAVRAAPERGKANDEIVEVLADFFNVAAQNVSVVSGMTSRNKKIRIDGLSIDTALARIKTLA
jgi:uncharacterized protein (TIGR00251 family)